MNIIDGIFNYNNNYNRYPNTGSGTGFGNPFNVVNNLISFGNQSNAQGGSYLAPNTNDTGIFSNLLGDSGFVSTAPQSLLGRVTDYFKNSFVNIFRNVGGFLSMFGVGRNVQQPREGVHGILDIMDSVSNSWDFSQNGGGRDALTTAMSGVLGAGCNFVSNGISRLGGSDLPLSDIIAADAGSYCYGVGESWGNSISDMIYQNDLENSPFILK